MHLISSEEEEVFPAVLVNHKQGISDFTMNLMKYALTKHDKKSGVNIKEFAEQLSKNLADTVNSSSEKVLIEKCEAAGSYLNINCNRTKLYNEIIKYILVKGKDFGSSKLENPKKIIVEHTSANPNAPLHVGNLRNVVIGSHLAKLFRFAGCECQELFYVNDLGAQIGLTALGYQYIYEEFKELQVDSVKIDQLVGRIYSIMNTLKELQKEKQSLSEVVKSCEEKIKDPRIFQVEDDLVIESSGDEFLDIAYSLYYRSYTLFKKLASIFEENDIQTQAGILNKKYEEKDPDAVKIVRGMCIATLRGMQQTLDRIQVQHDRFDFESELSWEGKSQALIDAFKKSPFYTDPTPEKGGYINLSKYLDMVKAKRGKGGYPKEYPPFYVLRPDFSTLYTLRDVCYSMKKIQEGDLTINVISTEQNLAQEKVALTLNALGVKGRPLVHFGYELVKLLKNGKELRMSSRKGIAVLSDDVINMMKEESLKFMEKREKLTEEKKQAIAETVATASLKYTLLCASPRSEIQFDVVKSVDNTGNTGAFILYCATRIHSILRNFENEVKNGKYKPMTDDVDFSSLASNQSAWNIVSKFFMSFASVVKNSVIIEIPEPPKLPEFQTQVIPQFCFNLCVAFNDFYTNTKVLTDDDTVYAKIKFCQAVLQVLQNALRLFGIETIEEM